MKVERLTQEQVLHLAKLARLELTLEEVERLAGELGQVLSYVAKLKELSPEPAGGGAGESGVALRADEVAPWPNPKELIAAAPERQAGLVSTPPVFGE